MLTSPNQYLRPEYLTPLPTTLDAKKSPLALLAQTCSQIGADTPNSKLLQSSEKSSKSKNDSQRDKNEPTNKSSKLDVISPREKSKSPEERSNSVSGATNRVRTPVASKPITNGRCSSNLSNSPRASPAERKSPATESNADGSATPEKSLGRTTPHTPSSSASKTAFTPNILTSSSDPAIKDLPLGTFKPGVPPPTSSPFIGGYPSFPLSMDLMASTLMNQHHALKNGGLVPYLGYGRIKSQDSLSSACRDPYCTGCSVSSHLLGTSVKSCPAGCTQCDHSKPPTTASYMSHGPAATAYAHAQLAALAAASHLPYVCNWISGDAAYCGKRFSSPEELLTHLRTHTSGAISDNSSALSMLGSPGIPPTHPLLHRTYPTPPLSPLATARYHPYSKPSLLPPSLSSSSLPGFPLGHPGISPYLSPYSLYGPRLGATPGMHQ
ncbi:zinc finger protein Elbow [Diorhabda carinulata]|uniref:zinc finger protein Elbow n=1 Tax=Diorhabda carinulata TaxID=1163345 RepID=UPI0025A2F1C9|nr:zinc finger protein Elbow [Diorhabda carinulata]